MNFIPRRQSPDGVQLKVFPIYIALVSENEGFKNTSVNRPFSNRRKTLLSGWVGGWVVIFWVLWFFSKSGIITSKMCWFQIWPQKLSTAIRSKVMSNLSLKMWNFKAHFRGGNRLKKMMVTKDLSSRRKLRKVFKKKFIEKKGFYDQKYEKNWKSKNGVKTALTPLFKELWAIYVFFTNLKIWRFQKH